MPALITHYLQACDVYDKLAKSGLELDKDAFCLGAQGPDFLYFHRALHILQPGKSLRNSGTMLHQQYPDQLFKKFGEYLTNNPEDKLALAYALGFICHYSLDRLGHPLVYFIQMSIIKGENIHYKPGCVHSRIEHNIDVIMLREKTQEIANAYHSEQCITQKAEVQQSAAKLLEYVINRIDEKNAVEAKSLVQAFHDTWFLQKISRDPTSIKRTLMIAIEKIFFMPPYLSTFILPIIEDGKWDYSNFENAVWKNPFDDNAAENTESFFDLYNQSIESSVKLINDFLLCLNNNNNFEFTNNLSFKTGLPMADEE